MYRFNAEGLQTEGDEDAAFLDAIHEGQEAYVEGNIEALRKAISKALKIKSESGDVKVSEGQIADLDRKRAELEAAEMQKKAA